MIPTLSLPTLGGRQFWGDIHFFNGWRIQQNVFTPHCRLLDPGDWQIVIGSRSDCLAALGKIPPKQKVRTGGGEAVILVHGILRSSKSMLSLTRRVSELGYYAVPFDYPSTQVEIPIAADYLQSVVSSLVEVERIHFVVHSMGGLVVRSLMQRYPHSLFGRMVMLGVPNRGAELADLFQQNILYRAVLGPAGQQLVTHRDGFIAQLPPPVGEFAVIAGARGQESGWNPLVTGDDDLTVSVASARLEEQSDFAEIPAWHSFMMSNPEVIEMTVRFLREGRLREKNTSGRCDA